MDLVLPVAGMCLQRACCAQALPLLVLKAAVLFSVCFQCQISTLQENKGLIMSATWQQLLLGQFHKSKVCYANGGIKS